MQARRGQLVDVLEGGTGSAFVAVLDGRRAGLVTWLAETEDGAPGSPSAAEIRALAVAGAARGRGVATALLAAAEDALRAAGVAGAWLVTTNDNLAALALYQRAGWRLVALRAGALDELRRSVKPSIPETGEHGIPLRDELELAKDL
jgi:ribosomal protein S18 acetylase RimI-like enzyme